jgi:pentatricopeptide repeat protein
MTWLNRMDRTAIKANLVTFCSLMNAYAIGDSWDPEKAKEVLATMPARGLKPDVSNYNSLINAYGRGKCDAVVEKMWEVYAQMEAAGVAPNAVTYTTLMRPYSMRGDWRRVEEVFTMMSGSPNLKDPLADPYVLSTLIHAYGHARPKQIQKLERVVADALEAGCKLTPQVTAALARHLGPQRTQVIVKNAQADRQSGDRDHKQKVGSSPVEDMFLFLRKAPISAPPGLGGDDDVQKPASLVIAAPPGLE